MPDRRILIVGPSWVGDMVMAQSLFIALRQREPDCRIDVLAPGWSRPLLERMPEVAHAIDMPLGHGELGLGRRRRLGRELREAGYDQAVVLPNSLKSALVPAFAKIPLRTGWRGEMRYGLLNDLRVLDEQRYPLMVERFVALAYPPEATLPSPIPRPALHIDAAQADALAARFGLSERPFLALCPGAEFGPSKRWPERHYAEVAAAYLQKGFRVVLFGSGNDRRVAQSIVEALPPTIAEECLNLCGQTTLAQAIDLLSRAAAVVSNDSGLMHIAAALGRPLVVVYGSTSPEFTPPLSDCVAIERIPVDCGPCFKRECPLRHLKCLVELEPSRVIRSLDRVLREHDSA